MPWVRWGSAEAAALEVLVASGLLKDARPNFDNDAATGADDKGEVQHVASDPANAGFSGLLDMGHQIKDVLTRIEGYLVNVAANTQQPIRSEPRLVRDPNNPRVTLTVRDVVDGYGNVTTETVSSRYDMRSTTHDASPVVGDAGAHSVGDVEVTPAVLRAVAGFIFDTGVTSDVARILEHLAIDLELQLKAGDN